jgi:L,D-transpeptidase ErfK/SrfK
MLVGLSTWTSVDAATFEIDEEGQRVIGHNMIVYTRAEDTLLDIARRFDLGYQDMAEANPDVDMWLPGEGTKVVLPTQYILPEVKQDGIVINIAELRLYYFLPKDKSGKRQVVTHPIGIGREGWATPLGRAKITQKVKDPSWTPPESIRQEHLEKGDPLPKVVPPGPENPLGAYAMRLSMPGYLMHGTDKPYGVGLRVSHGCIRLYPEDIEHMFYATPSSTAVNIIYQPQKAALEAGQLWLESHQTHSDIDHRRSNNMTPMVEAILKTQNFLPTDEEWPSVEQAVREHTGRVLPISQTEQDWVNDVWFLHAGLNLKVVERVRAAVTSLELDDLFLPTQHGAIEETLIGPFNAREDAELMAKEIEAVAGESLWLVQVDAEAL